jgi:hypothetical protein
MAQTTLLWRLQFISVDSDPLLVPVTGSRVDSVLRSSGA